MKLYRVHLLRHGTTKANEEGTYIGTTDLPLSSTGEREILNLKNKYNYPSAEVIYASPCIRCIQTSNLIYPNQKPLIAANLREYNFGDWEGKTADELKENQEFITWLKNSKENSPPNGDTGKEFYERTVNAFASLITGFTRANITDAAIITHAGIISTVLSVFGLPKASSIDWQANPGCGFSIRFTNQMWTRDNIFEVYDKLPK